MVICPIDSGRYGSTEMRRIFEEESRLSRMLSVEAAVAWAQAELGEVPREAAEEIARKANTRYVKLERCKELDAQIGHDVMAVVKALTEVCDGEGGRWVHYGLTSNDVLDTATALQLKEASMIIRNKILALIRILSELAVKYKGLPMAGRTHGQQIGIITLGLKFAVWLREMMRHLSRFDECMRRALVGKILGAVGTGAALGPKALEIQALALRRLGLEPADMVTQVVQRDIHAELVSVIANIGSTLDKFGTEIRNLQRTEIAELMEPFESERQVGSTAMPAKRNPVKCEKVCSLAKLLRGMAVTAFENVPLWHERDLTNSANERFIIPFSFILLDEMLDTMIQVLGGLVVYPENIKMNLNKTGGLLLSERVAVALVEKGMGRQEAHEVVRRCSMEAYREGIAFKEALLRDPEVSSKLSPEEMEKLLDPSTYLGVALELVDRAIETTRRELMEKTAPEGR
ncbi:MAG: adenylosuccinate lyase [Candidatus Bathyarchaeia archaeon]|nr:adenylosuccinate lyase [Candidatus Bathyarchaeota archaeon]